MQRLEIVFLLFVYDWTTRICLCLQRQVVFPGVRGKSECLSLLSFTIRANEGDNKFLQ